MACALQASSARFFVMRIGRLGVIFLVGVLGACERFRGSPFSTQVMRSERDLNLSAVASFREPLADGVLRIAVLSDSHQNYSDLNAVIAPINDARADFVVNLGDFTNSAYNMEYDQFVAAHVRLTPPVFTVPGNHDMIGAGPHLFRRLFGPFNFVQESAGFRFVFFNTANLESPEDFRPAWLSEQVSSSSKPVIIFTHIDLRDPERFAGAEAAPFAALLADARVKMVVTGHNHVYLLGQSGGTVFLQAPRTQGGQWLLLEIRDGVAAIKRFPSGMSESVAFK